MRIKFICCDVFARLACAATASSPHVVDVEFLPMLAHTEPASLHAKLQKRINLVDTAIYDRLVLGYGLCGNATAGLTFPLVTVMPRVHDCCAVFLGSNERYMRIFGDMLSMRWCTCGYHERAYKNGMNDDYVSYRTQPEYIKLLEEYGEDNAEYVWHTLHPALETKEAVYIKLDGFEHSDSQALFASWVEGMGKDLRVEDGDPSWFFKLVNGPWDTDNFLIIAPGQKIEPVYDMKEVLRATNV